MELRPVDWERRLVVLHRLFQHRRFRLRHFRTAHRDSPSGWLYGPARRCCLHRRWDRTMRPCWHRCCACSSWLGRFCVENWTQMDEIMERIFRLGAHIVCRFRRCCGGNFNVFQLFTLKMVHVRMRRQGGPRSFFHRDHAGHHHLLGGHPRPPAAPRAGRSRRRLLLRPEQKERECSAVCPKPSTSCAAAARCVGSNKRASSPPKGKICFNSATSSAHVAGR